MWQPQCSGIYICSTVPEVDGGFSNGQVLTQRAGGNPGYQMKTKSRSQPPWKKKPAGIWRQATAAAVAAVCQRHPFPSPRVTSSTSGFKTGSTWGTPVCTVCRVTQAVPVFGDGSSGVVGTWGCQLNATWTLGFYISCDAAVNDLEPYYVGVGPMTILHSRRMAYTDCLSEQPHRRCHRDAAWIRIPADNRARERPDAAGRRRSGVHVGPRICPPLSIPLCL